jgi:hypothetical protein
MKRLVILLPVLLSFQVGVQPALAWTWPVDGPVLRQFELGSDPYAAGQHRGIDIGAPTGTSVRAPAAGSVSFAGTVPVGGRTVTIRTADGYSVTLVHLGSIGVVRGTNVAEGSAVGTVGPSGDPEGPEPYLHLGIRLTADPNGYLDPLTFLPARDAPSSAPDPAPEAEPAGQAEAEAPSAVSTLPQPAPPPVSPLPDSDVSRTEPARGRIGRLRVVEPRPASVHFPPEGAAVRSRPGATRGRMTPGPAGQSLPARRSLRSFEPMVARGQPGALHLPHDGGHGLGRLTLLFAAALAAAAAALGLRRQLGDAGAAHVPAAMLLEGARSPAEDASALWPREENRLVLDGDLERVLLAQSEPLPNLDRDDDTAQLVDVSDDPRPRHTSRGARRRCHRLPRTVGLRARYPRVGAHA